ncbi:GGDEF domain-containing protein [Ureibacillus manganicus]|uniref:GGDEF domain-containing protein n=1 Tax=Ureibacillus manganicus TaxID=1266064 RepID=UPI00068D60AD|nr:diguanylate cyclase [Ureibacillus manganicus]
MKYNGRLITITVALVIGILFISYHVKKDDGDFILMEFFGFPIMLLIAWWGGFQFDKLKYLQEQVRIKKQELHKNTQVFKAIFEFVPIGIALIDNNSRPIISNKKLQEMLGYTEAELSTMTFKDFSYLDDAQTNMKLLNELVAGKIDHYVLEKRYIRKNGDILWGNVTTTLFPDIENSATYAIGMVNDITEKKCAEQQLHEAFEEAKLRSKRDGLTDIANRRYFDEYVQSEFNKAIQTKTPLSIIMLDIDYFKQYNDTYGHLHGDEVLKQVAKAIETTLCGSSDLVARYGGEEFVILLPNTDLANAKYVAEKVRLTIKNLAIPHEASNIDPHLTVSLGVSTIDGECKIANDLISRADYALYEAKENGSNQVVLYNKQKVHT